MGQSSKATLPNHVLLVCTRITKPTWMDVNPLAYTAECSTPSFTLHTTVIWGVSITKHVDVGQFLNIFLPTLRYRRSRSPKRAAPGRVWEELPGRSRLGSALQPATHKELFLHHPVAPGSLPCRQTVCTSQTLEPAPVAIPFEKSQVERAETLVSEIPPQTKRHTFLPSFLSFSPLTSS